MKWLNNIFTICLLLLIPLVGMSQKSKSMTWQVQLRELKKELGIYEKLSPFDNDQATSNIQQSQDRIISLIKSILNEPNIRYQNLEVLFQHPELGIDFSPDKKIYLLSLDAKTGGSFKERKTILYTQTLQGKNWIVDLNDEEEDEIIGSLNFHTIIKINPLENQFLLLGDAITCNSCISAAAVLLEIKQEEIEFSTIDVFDGYQADFEKMEWNKETNQLTLQHLTSINGDPLLMQHNDYELEGDEFKYRKTIIWLYKNNRFYIEKVVFEMIDEN